MRVLFNSLTDDSNSANRMIQSSNLECVGDDLDDEEFKSCLDEPLEYECNQNNDDDDDIVIYDFESSPRS